MQAEWEAHVDVEGTPPSHCSEVSTGRVHLDEAERTSNIYLSQERPRAQLHDLANSVVNADVSHRAKLLWNAIIDTPTSWMGQVRDEVPLVGLMGLGDSPKATDVAHAGMVRGGARHTLFHHLLLEVAVHHFGVLGR